MGSKLSPTEEVIVNYAADGFGTKHIVDALGISPRTVDTHKTRIFLKLKAKNMNHAVSICAERRLLL